MNPYKFWHGDVSPIDEYYYHFKLFQIIIFGFHGNQNMSF